MKKIKYAISILIIVFVVLCSNVCFGKSSDTEYIAKFLINIGVLNGYPNGELQLNNSITREEFAKLMVLASTYKDNLDLYSKSSPFSDVTKERWSSSYVKVAAQNGILLGYPDLTFKPENNILLEEAAVISLRILNYTSKDYGSSWPYSQVNFAKEKNILLNINKNIGENITRGDAINIIFNTLVSNINGQNIKYINLINYSIIEDVQILASNIQDSTIPSDSVLTSIGAYKLKNIFDNGTIGTKASLIINSEKEIIAIVPYLQNVEEYELLSLSTSGLVVKDKKQTKVINIDKDCLVYYNSNKMQLSNMLIIPQYCKVKIFYNNSKIDYIVLIEQDYEGPYQVMNSSWKVMHNIDQDAEIIKNEITVENDDITINDIVYWYKDINKVIVYNNKVTGIIEKITPNVSSASKITVNGIEYGFETPDVYFSIQSYEAGDNITILLGKDNNIAYILDEKENINVEQLGILVNAGTEMKKNVNGIYSEYYVDVILCTGEKVHYTVNSDYTEEINKIVKVNSNNKNIISLFLQTQLFSGIVNADTYKIGNVLLDRNVKILEAATDNNIISSPIKIYLKRLDNLKLTSDNVLAYTKNVEGKIDNLILTNVTNDMYTYGIVYSIQDLLRYNNTVIYTYFQNGKILTGISNGKLFNVTVDNPVGIISENGIIKDMIKLTHCTEKINNATSSKLVTNNNEYMLSSNVCVYKKIDLNEYLVSNLNEVINNFETISIRAYYDKAEEKGGKIRVIVIE